MQTTNRDWWIESLWSVGVIAVFIVAGWLVGDVGNGLLDGVIGSFLVSIILQRRRRDLSQRPIAVAVGLLIFGGLVGWQIFGLLR